MPRILRHKHAIIRAVKDTLFQVNITLGVKKHVNTKMVCYICIVVKIKLHKVEH